MTRSSVLSKEAPCQLDHACIDSFDEVDGSEVLALIWCDTHHHYHWRWIAKEYAEGRFV